MNVVECVDRSLAVLSDTARVGFAVAPIDTLTTELGLAVTAVEHLTQSRDDGGACDGVSFLEDGVILYAPTPTSRRQNFTLAHELGHWLVEQADGVYDWLADQDDAGRILESLCDRIAQRLLLPDDAARAVIGDGPIRARHVLELYSSAQASRPVCAIALSKFLPGLGAIAIISRYTREVEHASIQPDSEQGWPTVYPWRGQELNDSHALLQVAPGAALTRRMTWNTPWNTQAEFYVDAIGGQDRVVAVFSHVDVWDCEAFHAPLEREFDARLLLRGTCCGQAFERRGYPCSNCLEPFCPKCGLCGCDRVAKREVVCMGCFLRFLPHLVVDGRCVECRS
jgi:hypothetical protein